MYILHLELISVQTVHISDWATGYYTGQPRSRLWDLSFEQMCRFFRWDHQPRIWECCLETSFQEQNAGAFWGLQHLERDKCKALVVSKMGVSAMVRLEELWGTHLPLFPPEQDLPPPFPTWPNCLAFPPGRSLGGMRSCDFISPLSV